LLTGQQLEAALLVADGALSLRKIAKRLEIAERTLDYWITEPEFKAEIQRHRTAWREKIFTLGFANKDVGQARVCKIRLPRAQAQRHV
jgi:hypothetical protein